MNEKLMKEVLADEAFAKSLLKMNSPADVVAALKGKGVDITEDEFSKYRDKLISSINKADELDEESLNEVAGGIAVRKPDLRPHTHGTINW